MSDVAVPVTPAPVVETPAVAPVAAPATPEDAQFASKIAALTRKEQSAVKAMNEAKAAKAEAERLNAEAKAIQSKWDGYKGKPEKGLEALKELGLDYSQITQLYLNNGAPTPEMLVASLEQRLNATEAQRAADLAAAEEAKTTQAKAEAEAATAQFKTAISEHVSDVKQYPLISHFGQTEEVYNLIDGHYQKTSQILEIAAAAKMVEDYLREHVTKARELIDPKPPATPPATQAPTPPAWTKRPPGQFAGSPAPATASTLTPSTVPVTQAPTTTKPVRYPSKQQAMAETLAKFKK